MRMLCLLAVIVIACVFAAPASAAKTWTQDKFEIGGWKSPVGDFALQDETYARAEAAGFTLLTGPGWREGEDTAFNKKVLDLCAKHGMRVIVRDSRIHLDPQTEDDKRALDAVIADYGKHPALYGYYLKDEPNPEAYAKLVELHAYFRKKDPTHLPYINLFPNYGGPHQLQFPDYDGYVRGFIEAVHPLMLSYDHYSFKREGERADWFANLEVVRRDSLAQGIPMWVIIQALQDATRYRPPTLNQMYWQVNTSLAYGAKSIWYFPYWSTGEPDKPEEWHYMGVILPNGEPGPQYAAACEINPKLKALGPMLMGLRSVSVTHLGDVPLRAKGFEPDDLISAAAGDRIVIGRFADKGRKSVLMLVNRDWDAPGEVRLTLRKGDGIEELGRIGPGESLGAAAWAAEAKQLSVKLAPGEGRLIRVR